VSSQSVHLRTGLREVTPCRIHWKTEDLQGSSRLARNQAVPSAKQNRHGVNSAYDIGDTPRRFVGGIPGIAALKGPRNVAMPVFLFADGWF
jgi:hypothetical protein